LVALAVTRWTGTALLPLRARLGCIKLSYQQVRGTL
jgi:hypothetical protein